MNPLRIAVVGPESTGKSTLSGQLAEYYRTVWVPEYARTYLDYLQRPYTPADVEGIARGQLAAEDEAAGRANGLLICDTNLTVIQIWFEHAYGYCPDWIRRVNRERPYALHLLTNIDIPWEPDPQREHPELREYLFHRYRHLLVALPAPFCVISGDANERLRQAVAAINQRLIALKELQP